MRIDLQLGSKVLGAVGLVDTVGHGCWIYHMAIMFDCSGCESLKSAACLLERIEGMVVCRQLAVLVLPDVDLHMDQVANVGHGKLTSTVAGPRQMNRSPNEIHRCSRNFQSVLAKYRGRNAVLGASNIH